MPRRLVCTCPRGRHSAECGIESHRNIALEIKDAWANPKDLPRPPRLRRDPGMTIGAFLVLVLILAGWTLAGIGWMSARMQHKIAQRNWERAQRNPTIIYLPKQTPKGTDYLPYAVPDRDMTAEEAVAFVRSGGRIQPGAGSR